MAKLRSSSDDGETDPKMAFGLEILGWHNPREKPPETLRARLYIEAFGSTITRPVEARYLVTSRDISALIDWISEYLEQKVEVQKPFRTLEPAFELRLTPISGDMTSVFAKLLAFGTVPDYFDEETGPSISFETSNRTIGYFRDELTTEVDNFKLKRAC